MRLSPSETATRFIDKYFPDCHVAILSGSVVRFDANLHSDLDIVIFDDTQEEAFHAAYFEWEWPIESFVLHKNQWEDFFLEAQKIALPSLLRMCVEGIVLKDDGTANEIINRAKEALKQGPVPWTLDKMNQQRYEITECLFDLEGSSNRNENVFVVNKLSFLVTEFILRVEEQWTGDGKWAIRSLQLYDTDVYTKWTDALEHFYMSGTKRNVIAFSDEVLEPYGGRLFAGYTEITIVPIKKEGYLDSTDDFG